MNRVDRLLGYLLILQSRKVVRARDLATRFEVTERTVYRDIEALYEVGVPIVGMAGEGYQLTMPGSWLAESWFLSCALHFRIRVEQLHDAPSLQTPLCQ
jgi:predicted DNA-binding transcriptional regulator YafY